MKEAPGMAISREHSTVTNAAPASAIDYQNLLACIRCGACLPACPTYREEGLEAQSPRGRVALIKAVVEGRLEANDGYAAHLYHCLDCRACESVCPSGVKIGHLVVAARADLEAKKPKPHWLKRLVLRKVLTSPAAMERSAAALRLYQRAGLRALVRRTGLLKLFPKPLQDWEGLLPDLPSRSAQQQLPLLTAAKGLVRHRVAIFAGCAMNVAYSNVTLATVRVLARNGCEVVNPGPIACCGAPHVTEGDRVTAQELARQNVDAFEALGIDYVVTDAGACGCEMKEYGHLLEHDPSYAGRAQVFAAKVRDVAELLCEIGLQGELGTVDARVTYHESCHLAHGQGITRQPRELLKKIPGLDFVELPEASWCCGSAGSYVLTHHDRSMKILDRKMGNVARTKAEIIASANPGCSFQLNLGLQRAGIRAEILHPVELLDRAYAAAERGSGS